MMATGIFKVTGAGRWFPADAGTLRTVIEAYLAEAEIPAIAEPLLGAIAPHAGLAYSGRTAGHTYAALRADAARHGAPDCVLVLGFSHQPAPKGLALLDAASIVTPLGSMPIDRALLASLHQSVPGARLDVSTHISEHSAENQLPFLQCALPGVPVVVGLFCGHQAEWPHALAEALLSLRARGRCLCIASTDLLHDPRYETVCATDADTLALMEKLDSEGLNGAWSLTRQVCCGIAPVLGMLAFVRAAGCQRGKILFYENSGDVDPSGRGQWVVGYGSVVYPVPMQQ